jgi:hypothetical protein
MSVAAIALLAGLVALAQGAKAAGQAAFADLTSQGYEIKAVTLLPLDAAQRVDHNVTFDTVLVTLQKSASVAVCEFPLVNWINMKADTLADARLCDAR